ncbi:excinuclease ABC subunit B [Primorskyibacter sp. S187A]|uniref:excinuclease ABC subunit B n=1 Tax=Primorskyibacter sp. S187A TaxID=3415130 RepID=UPI003C7B2269
MRYLALLAGLMAGPAAAWDFSPEPICTLRLEGPVAVEVTYDARLPEYAIHITRPGGWPEGPVFALRFEGPRGLMISTDRHVVEGETLSVRDSGFGNVLAGLQYNERAVALLGDAAVPFDLSGAGPAVEAFRACPVVPSV